MMTVTQLRCGEEVFGRFVRYSSLIRMFKNDFLKSVYSLQSYCKNNSALALTERQ